MTAPLVTYVIAYLSLGLALLLISCFVLIKGARSRLNQIFATYSFSIAWWSLFTVPMITANNSNAALVWDRICLIGAIFIPTTFIHFVVILLNQTKKYKTLIILSYAISSLFLLLNFTPYFIADVKPRFAFNFYTVPSPAYMLFVLFFSGLSTLGVLMLFYELQATYKRKDMAKVNYLKWLFYFSVLGYLGGGTNFLLVYGFEVPFITPVANYAVLAYALAVSYIILRYRFLDIQVVLKRTLVFAGLLGFVFSVFSAATFLVREILGVYFGASNVLSYAISIFLIVLGYDPIRNLLVDITDRYLFQKKYDYQKLLKDASRGIARIESLHHLFGLVIHFITMRMRVRNAAILTRQQNETRFNLEFHRGYEKSYMAYFIDSSSPLIEYLSAEKETLDMERVDEYIHAGNLKRKKGEKAREYDFFAIKQQMDALEACFCVPSFLGRELRNILILGPKKSGEMYTEGDANVLYTLAQESAIAIENARLYDEAINKTKELEKINEALESAKSSLTHALQETEAANKQLQDTQAQLIHEQKMATLGRLAASVGHEVNNPLTILSMNVSRAILKYRKNPDLKVGEILDVFQKMEQNISRIKAVVNTLTGLLKKSEKGKFEPLSLKLILEETLPLVQFQTYLDNLAGTEVEFNVPGNTPLIRGDLERLQEVFLNLFINAYHAMSGRRNPRIEVRAEIAPDNPEMIAVFFEDNGKGMDDKTRKKIFNYGFTTKPPGKGSGLGLYMCKYIIELHGGDIQVKSTPDVGTTFILTLPIYKEDSISDLQPQIESA